MKHLIKYILFLFLLIFSINSYSCINEYPSIKEDGTTEDPYELHTRLYRLTDRFDIKRINFKKREAEILLKKDPRNFKVRSNYASILLRLGEVDSAIAILKNLYRLHPNEYAIVANLGTAYELYGNVDSAYAYLKKAVQINPNAHDGSEWIHLKILERWIDTTNIEKKSETSIIGFNVPDIQKFHSEYLKQPQKYKDSMEALKYQLLWQLEERTDFIEPSNMTVASLLYDLANLTAITESIDHARPVYELAMVYDPNNYTPKIRNTYMQLMTLGKTISPPEPPKGQSYDITWLYNLRAVFFLIFASILIFIVILIKKKKKATRHAK